VKNGEQLLNTFKRNNMPLFLKILKLKASDQVVNGSVKYRVFEFEEVRSVTEVEADLFAMLQSQGMTQSVAEPEGPVSAEKGAEILGGEIVEEEENELPFK
jgi:hypothetical protein